MRLIDANGSFTLNAADNTDYGLCFSGGIISVMDDLGRCVCEFFADDAPTVDAVEVVRCKDCNFWVKGRHHTGRCNALISFHEAERYATEEGHFCSYGERKNKT